jgi:hypothetical protein
MNENQETFLYAQYLEDEGSALAVYIRARKPPLSPAPPRGRSIIETVSVLSFLQLNNMPITELVCTGRVRGNVMYRVVKGR